MCRFEGVAEVFQERLRSFKQNKESGQYQAGALWCECTAATLIQSEKRKEADAGLHES